MAFLLKNTLKLGSSKKFLNVYCLSGLQLHQQSLKTSTVSLEPHKQNPNTAPQNEATTTSNAQKKSSKESIKITLMQNENMTVTGLEEAKHLAKRRSMHLVKIQDLDTKTQRPVYKLLTAAEMLQNELADMNKPDKGDMSSAASGPQKKSEKSLSISARIADHDLQSRLKNISKWLSKQHEVRILIQGNSEHDLGNCEKIFKTIDEYLKTPKVIGRVVQKRTKGPTITTVRFYSKLYKQYPHVERLLSSSASNSSISSTYKGPLAFTCLGILFITVKYFFWWKYLKPSNNNAQTDNRVKREKTI